MTPETITALSDWAFVARFFRAGVAALFLALGIACMILWRQELAKPREEGSSAAPSGAARLLPLLAWLFLTAGIAVGP